MASIIVCSGCHRVTTTADGAKTLRVITVAGWVEEGSVGAREVRGAAADLAALSKCGLAWKWPLHQFKRASQPPRTT